MKDTRDVDDFAVRFLGDAAVRALIGNSIERHSTHMKGTRSRRSEIRIGARRLVSQAILQFTTTSMLLCYISVETVSPKLPWKIQPKILVEQRARSSFGTSNLKLLLNKEN